MKSSIKWMGIVYCCGCDQFLQINEDDFIGVDEESFLRFNPIAYIMCCNCSQTISVKLSHLKRCNYQKLKVNFEGNPFILNGSIIDEEGNKYWYKDGELHREDGPAYEGIDGDKEWYKKGKLHRLDGPAYENTYKDKWWYKEGKLHREDGPAIEEFNGTKVWYKEGKLHRENGAAIEYINGYNGWWYEGEEIKCNSQEEFESILKSRNLI